MIRVAILCVLLTGCGARQMNVGAQWPIYEAPDAQVQTQWRTATGGKWRVLGYTDFERRETWIVSGLPRTTFAGVLINEYAHIAERHGIWEAAILLEGGKLRTTCDDMPAEAKGKVKAMAEYRKALDNTK